MEKSCILYRSSRPLVLSTSLVAILSLTLLSQPALAAKKGVKKANAEITQNEAVESCKASLLMDVSTGEILSEVNAHESRPPASMAKMMTAYVVFKRIKEGSLKFDDVVTASAFASKIGGSQVYLKEGEQFTVKELLEALLVQSANDAAVALAEHIAGESSGFVEIMNAEAQNLGMRESVFHSPHGLPPGKGQEADEVSAYDLAILGRSLISEFPMALEFTGKSEATFRNGEFIMRNHNHLVRTFPGCDGLKTGYYQEAGFGVTATAKKNGMRMLTVVMGCERSKERDSEAARLLSSGFAKYRSIKVIDKGAAADQAVNVSGGEAKQVTPVAADSLSVLVKLGDEKKVEKRFNLCSSLTAPVKPNTECGSLSALIDGKEVGKVPMIVVEEVKPLGVGGKILRMFGK